MKLVFRYVFGVGIFLAFAGLAEASPGSLSYQGRLLKTDGSPLEYSGVQFDFKIMDPSGQYTIYEELSNLIDMTNSGGVFDVPIGTGTKVYPDASTGNSSYTTSMSLLDAFNNGTHFYCKGSSTNANCYAPLADDARVLRVQFYDGSGWKTVTPDSVIRSVPFAGYSLSAQKLGTNTASDFVLKTGVNGGATCSSGNFLTWDSATQTFGCAAVSGASGGTVTDVTASAPLSVTNGTSTPNISMLAASSSQNGYLTSTDWTNFNNKLSTTTSFSGDVSGTSSTTSVDKLKGTALSISSLTSGQFLKYNGTNWVNANIAQSDVSGLTATLSGYMTTSAFNTAVASAGCSTSQTLYWNSVSSAFACQSISVSGFTGSLAGDVSGTQGATSVDKIKGVGVDFSTAPTSGQVLKYDGTNWAPAADNDAGASASSANTANTIVKRDASGNFTAGTITANLTGAASLNVLKAGDSMSGNLSFANTKGTVFTDTGSNTATITGPSSAIGTSYVLRLPTAQGSANQALVNDGSGNLSWQSLSTGSVTSVSASAPLSSTGGATPTISIAQASSTTNGYLSSTDWSTFNSKLSTASSFSGDVSGTSSTTSVDKLKGTSLSISSLSSGNYLKYNGTNWVNVTPSSADLSDASSLIKSSQMPANCAAGQTLTFSSPTGSWTCSNIVVTASNFGSQAQNTFLAAPNGSAGTPTFRTIASADLPAGTLSGSGTSGYVPYYSGSTTLANSAIYQSGGNVGIGTTSPGTVLDVNGTLTLRGSTSGATTLRSPASGGSGTLVLPSGNGSNGQILQTDGSGNLSWISPSSSFTAGVAPSFYAFPSSNITGGSGIKLTMDSVLYDTNNNYSSSTGRYTPTVAGKYLVQLAISCQSSIAQARIYKNGGLVNYSPLSASGGERAVAEILVDMNGTTDYLESYGYCQNGTSDSIYGGNAYNYTHFFGALIAPLASGNVAGTGTANYIPYWTNSTTLSSSPLSVSGSKVGIGTATPSSDLTVYDHGGASENAIGIDGAAATYREMSFMTGGIVRWIFGEDNSSESGSNAGSNLYINSYTDAGAYLRTNISINRASGNVGIGTTTPTETLDVGGGNVKMGYERVTQTCNVTPSSACAVSCSAGKQVMGGGCTVASVTGGYIYLQNNDPTGTTGWDCYYGGTYTSATTTAFAMCANIK